MQDKRFRVQQAGEQTGTYILYWMQQAQRVDNNPALSHAVSVANRTKLPLIVVFVLSDHVPDANYRHYYFMLQGLCEVAKTLQSKGIDFYFICGDPVEVVATLAIDALEVVADHGYLRYQREWRSTLAKQLAEMDTAYTEIETEALIPVTQVSDKEEYAAATIRKKMMRLLPEVSLELEEEAYNPVPAPILKVNFPLRRATKHDFPTLLQWVKQRVSMDKNVLPVTTIEGGACAAKRLMHLFIETKLPAYHEDSNNPVLDIRSRLSPYLHFGQISAMEIVQHLLSCYRVSLPDLSSMIVNKAGLAPLEAGIAAFAEQLIVRRELSFNYCFSNPNYDNFNGLPVWAKDTLLAHVRDKREAHYSLDRLEQCNTNDAYWNAAQFELAQTGNMHSYMRMYWGKRLLAWCDSPETAFQMLVYLNNRYELDGRDPNAYAGIAWCFGKHDRPWQNRKIYGMVRYMNSAGLDRRFDMEAYLKKVQYPQGI